MRDNISTVRVIVQIAFRNLFASRLKTFIVGGIVFFGALLVVVGTSFLDSIDQGMSRSIIGSVAGHIQVYSAESKDELEVMGGFNIEGVDLAQLDDFSRIRSTIGSVPHVQAVVPMGISGAIVTSGNTIDVALGDLRDLVRKKLEGSASTADLDALQAAKGHVRQILLVLQGDLKNLSQLHDQRTLSADDGTMVTRAASDEFWRGFDRDPMDALEFLDNRIAPQATDADMLFLRYVGTDPDAFARSFDRLKIVDGTAIPRGKRGFLFAKFTYEEQVKLKTARRLDKIKMARDDRGATIAKDAELQRFVKENSSQVREILLQLDAPKTALFREKLRRKLGRTEADVARLLSDLLRTDDANFDDRYRFFYAELAPALQMYRVRIGDTLTIKAFTKGGYVQSVNLPVYGTFNFTGLEKSPQAGGLSLMDMVSFRELYGFLTEDREKEILEIKAAMNARDISRENAEAELFGSQPDEAAAPPSVTPGVIPRVTNDAAQSQTKKQTKSQAKSPTKNATKNPTKNAPRPVPTPTTGPAAAAVRNVVADATPGIHPPKSTGVGARLARQDLTKRVYDPAQLQNGVVLNAAVILDDAKRIPETIRAIEEAGRRAGLPLKAVSWQKASGLIGQFVTMMRAVLYTAVLIIFVVALVIINNALVMATLERVREIGTLRAIGAQRRFILSMLMIEALVVGIVFGAAGAGVGAGLVAAIGKVGIPAKNDIFYFFFSGPRLHPAVTSTNLGGALGIVLLVSGLSALYPAWLAMRVTPRQAMQGED